jgi:exonuclease V
VDAETIFARYNLKPLEPFSEIFMLEIDGLSGDGEGPDNDMFIDPKNPFSILQDTEVQQHNSLLALWSLMISEFSETIDTFSDILRAEFRYSKTGEMIGSTMVTYDPVVIEDYVATEMKWWKGEREAEGVEIEEAFKCRSCDFAEECSWRKGKVEEAMEKSRLRAKARGKSDV